MVQHVEAQPVENNVTQNLSQSENPEPEESAASVVIINPEDSDSAIECTVNGEVQTLQPGESLEVEAGSVVKFERTAGGEMLRYTLRRPAEYTFAYGDDGWNIWRAE